MNYSLTCNRYIIDEIITAFISNIAIAMVDVQKNYIF